MLFFYQKRFARLKPFLVRYHLVAMIDCVNIHRFLFFSVILCGCIERSNGTSDSVRFEWWL